MRKFLLGFMLLSVTFIVRAESLIYTATGEAYELSSTQKAIASLVYCSSSSPMSNILLFVHGRGAGLEPKTRHPQKALIQILPNLEKEYGVKVLLFNWPGSADGSVFGLPVPQARASAGDLLKVLNQIKQYQQKCSNFQLSVLSHSTGSAAVEEMLIKNIEEIPAELVHSLIFSSSASVGKEHTTWMRFSSFAKNTYVFVNPKDPILLLAGILRPKRLGRGVKKINNSVNYIDVRNIGWKHRYYIATTKKGGDNGQGSNGCLHRIFDAILNGWVVDLAVYAERHRPASENYFRLFDKGNPACQ